ncbi:putative plasma membrane antiporter [Aspergillus mulundensis]|uniref:Carbohydrate kinase PfkB domain-containing protein n=1 Tax=Aspergillus mulundensis TaxID=1810919 RepID=A0A3D8S4W2_9EURO|nr:hypothetical protein DSM5745_04708 [Aspergillus mulundensis]RDW81151.1 hypothetical protein DSM5745_04708 [Aspergillus mulundensis]
MYQADSPAHILRRLPCHNMLSALIIGSCVTCTDPILSQAIAKGPFADNYVRRHLREFISSEAGGNDGFGFPFLLLGLALLRYADTPANAVVLEEFDLARGGPDFLGAIDVGRFGGGVGKALKHWFVEGFLYMIVLGAAYGITVGFLCRKAINLSSKRKWIDPGSFTLVPAALGAFIVGSCGCFGSDETLACFVAGNMLNWDGLYNAELQARHDSFNSSLETVMNYITFGYLGAVMPWEEFHMPDATGITFPRLFGLGMMILVFRRIPAIMAGYRFMPAVCSNWREALFMGHFGPIGKCHPWTSVWYLLTTEGVGAIAYVEYARRLFPDRGESDREINNLTAAMRPVVYWLVLFSIIVHGLSVPILYVFYKALKVRKVHDHPVEVVLLSENEPLPNNSTVDRQRHSVLVNNRFSEPNHLHVLNDDPDEEKEEESADLRGSSERIRPRSKRSSMSYSLATSASGESSQRTGREADTTDMTGQVWDEKSVKSYGWDLRESWARRTYASAGAAALVVAGDGSTALGTGVVGHFFVVGVIRFATESVCLYVGMDYDREPSISFTSLGLLILDDIRFPGHVPLTDVLGGSGAYATLGARLFLPPPLSNSLGWMLHIGNDFPEPTRCFLESWDATLRVEKELAKPSTRGLLEYKDTTFGPKTFKYTTPILQVETNSLNGTPLLASRAYHFLESPQIIKARVADILALRKSSGMLKRPLIIWEPAPLSCKTENLQPCIDAAQTVDVFSPNHLELARLCGEPSPAGDMDREKIESLAQRFLDAEKGVGPDGKGIAIVRAGEHGCLVCARLISPTWLPPFYKPGNGNKVVDPTGAGNSFLGAFAVGYIQTGDAIEAACYGSVGASFALEQVGMPELAADEGAPEAGELWNGERVLERLREYRRTLGLLGR